MRYLLPLVGCGLMMLVCTGLMGGGARVFGRRVPPEPTTRTDEVTALREEVAHLRAELDGRKVGDPIARGTATGVERPEGAERVDG